MEPISDLTVVEIDLNELEAAGPPDVLVQRARSRYVRVVKPAFDVSAALVIFLLVLPVLLVTAAAVRVVLGEGVIYRQARVGRGGNVFHVYKFRTMRHDRRRQPADFSGPDRRRSHKRSDDPRHTPLGRFLRRWSFDELPQIWNVLCGDMSLVGPRPELVDVVTAHGLSEHPRHLVKPGITGLWQISDARRSLLHECLDHDVDYVRRLSFATDVRILGRTLRAVLRGDGA